MTKLTPRQQQVARLIALGHVDKSIARELGISDTTARFHVLRSLRSSGCANRSHLAALAVLDGLVTHADVLAARITRTRRTDLVELAVRRMERAVSAVIPGRWSCSQ